MASSWRFLQNMQVAFPCAAAERPCYDAVEAVSTMWPERWLFMMRAECMKRDDERYAELALELQRDERRHERADVHHAQARLRLDDLRQIRAVAPR
jgi:hypothetical protein